MIVNISFEGQPFQNMIRKQTDRQRQAIVLRKVFGTRDTPFGSISALARRLDRPSDRSRA